MNKVLLISGGLCAALAGVFICWPPRDRSARKLAQRLSKGWADHHTVA